MNSFTEVSLCTFGEKNFLWGFKEKEHKK